MAEVNGAAFTSGIHRGIELAVAGGLVSEEEVSDPRPAIEQANHEGRFVITETDDDMPPWRQVIVGELLGTACAARHAAGTESELDVQAVRDALSAIWGVIDRW
jgi:hypothetical protein